MVHRFLGLVALMMALAGCASSNGGVAANRCDAIDNGDGTKTFKEIGLTVSRCVSGESWSNRTCPWHSSDGDWYSAMKEAGEQDHVFHQKRIWRMATRADIEVLGSCHYKRMGGEWVAELSADKEKAIVLEDGKFQEKQPITPTRSVVGIFVSGNNGSAQQTYERLMDESVRPYFAARKAAWEKKQAEQNTAWKARQANAEREHEALLRRQTAALSSAPKGTLLNCNTQEVVPVNTSLNTVSFACPSFGNVSFQTLQKHKWKLNSTERIKAQAASYREDAYGSNNWNGQGVVISIMVEKQ
jgi:hypothetical protein